MAGSGLRFDSQGDLPGGDGFGQGWTPRPASETRGPAGEPSAAAAWERPFDGFSLHLDAEVESLPGQRSARAAAATRTLGVAGADDVIFPGPGDLVAGFRIITELGRGAFARVYLAEQAELADRPVALKVSQALGGEPQALARLQHTHIVPIHSIHDDRATGLRLLCMPYYGGANLAQVLETAGARLPSEATGASLVEALDAVGCPSPTLEAASHRYPSDAPPPPPAAPRAATRGIGPPTLVRSIWARHLARMPWWSGLEPPPASLDGPAPEEPGQPARRFLREHTYVQAAAWIATRLAEALEHAHARGILHRDIKPSNILIAADGTPMLLDFNLATDEANPAEKAFIGGTIPYMAPEHLDAFNPEGTTPARAIDARCDLYALGLILFEMVAGHHPFADPPEGLPLPEMLRRVRAERLAGAPSARRSNPQVPPSLDAILARCLDPDPRRRYGDAGALAEDLRRFLDDRPLRHAPETSPRERAAKWLRRHPEARSASAVALLAAGLLLATGAVGWSVARGLEAASARVLRNEFRAAFDECQLLLNTTGSTIGRRNLDDGLRRAATVLDRYGVFGSGDWTAGPLVRRLPPAEARALREQVAELVLLASRARVVLAQGGSEPARRRALEGGIAWLDRAERFDPSPSAALYDDRARYHAALGRADLAARDRARAAALPPVTARDDYLAGMADLAAGRTDAAEDHLEQAVARDPRRFWAWFALGLCRFDQGRYAESAADFGVCSALEPGFAWPPHNRGLALARAGRLREARRAYDQALAVDPRFAEARRNRALACLELGDPSAALQDLDEALTLGRRDPATLAARAEALARLGRHADAEADFARALHARPADPLLLVARGFARLRTDTPGAAADFASALRQDPNNTRALLGQAHLARPQDPAAALSLVELALRSAPGDADALRLRALLLARKGDPAAARDAERLALTPTPHNLYNAACALSVLARERNDPSLLPRALDLLRRALDAGFPRPGLTADPDLSPLHARPEWPALVGSSSIPR